MVEFLKHIFYSDVGNEVNNISLLIFRILLAFQLFHVHGLRKIKGKSGQQEHVPNPLHLPEKFNKLIATFADLVVPFLVMLGVATRLAVLPVIGVTAVGYFIVHRKDSMEVKDVPFLYALSFMLLLFLGARTYSVDHHLLHPLF